MNVFLLMIALACHADAPKVDLHELPAAAAAAPTVQCAAKVAEAAETAAVVAVLPEANVTAKAEPSVGMVEAVGESNAAKANQPVELTAAREASKTVAGSVGEVQPAKDGDACSLVGMYSRCRLLSGPWSVKRRLEAARIRGDTEEEERMTELLEEVVCEALEAE